MERTMPSLGKSLGSIRRRSVDLSNFSPVKESLLGPEETLPLIIEPAADHVDLAEWVRNSRADVDRKMAKHGGILFRGFGLKDAREFQRVAAALTNELFADYGDLPRESLAEKVYASTPYPEDKMILYHNESSHMASWPSRINFFCMIVAKEGGATPIVDCRKVYKSLDPKVREAFEQKGLKYIRNFCEGLDVSWQRFFSTDDRAAVEEQCRAMGTTCEWTGKDNLRISQLCRGVLRHPITGEMCFFNQVQLHHVHCLDKETLDAMLSIFSRDDLPRDVQYGDGTPIEDSVMDHIGEMYEKHAVRFQYQPGDMVSLDNMLVAHARDTFSGPRKIVVALGDMVEGHVLDAAAQPA